MDIDVIKMEYKLAKEGATLSEAEEVRRTMKFVKTLMSDNRSEVLDYHYSLLRKREYKSLYYSVRAAFEKRPNAEEYLQEKITIETDPTALADILHLLGQIRSPKAAHIAREFLDKDNSYQRKVAMYVLGWVGTENDIALLREHMLNEEDAHLRITAASAHRQIAWHHKELKEAVLRSLKIGYENEKDDKVLPWIIVMLATVAVKNLGLREDKDNPNTIHGDLQKAKKKTEAFLKRIK